MKSEPRSNVRRPVRFIYALLVVAVVGCRPSPNSSPSAGKAEDLSTPDSGEWFIDGTELSGLDFVHFNGMSGVFYDAEIFGPGVAMFDYDNDGDLDLFIVQGQMLGSKPLGAALFPPRTLPLQGRLYRNDSTVAADGTRTVGLVNVTASSGINANGYGMGVAAGDVDNDGWIDLYLTNLGPNQLWRNNGNGTFSDVSKRSGTDDPGWGVSAAFVDIDRDGWLDLFVGNYLTYSVDRDVDCSSVAGMRDYCAPSEYRPQPDRLYRNRGDGTFADVTATSLVGGQYGPALGVVTADMNADGWIDMYVANDGQENLLWLNQRDGTFRNAGAASGAALNADGRPESSMGVDAGDFDNDGDEDLYMTHWQGEKNTLYVQQSPGIFEDRTAVAGLTAATLAPTGFGTAWGDFDNDGWLDLFVANGAVITIEALARANDPFPLHEPDQLFRNLGNGRFADVTTRAGQVLARPEVGRGAAVGDIDNDGDLDVIVGNNNGPARLLLNVMGTRHHWVGLRLVGERHPRTSGGAAVSAGAETRRVRDMVGARVGVTSSDGATRWRRARADGSYASASDPRVLVGLGAAAGVSRVEVVWPSGRRESWGNVAVDRYTTLTEGTAP
jgi:hypothetical protein